MDEVQSEDWLEKEFQTVFQSTSRQFDEWSTIIWIIAQEDWWFQKELAEICKKKESYSKRASYKWWSKAFKKSILIYNWVQEDDGKREVINSRKWSQEEKDFSFA